MSAKRSVVIGGFVITDQEVKNNGFLSVASNRLKGSGKNPTDQQIQELANDFQNKFSDLGGSVVPSVSRP